MPSLDVIVTSNITLTPRIQQISGMFDVPPREKLEHSWKADLPLDERPWHVGLIVGSSGSGKTQCARALWGEELLGMAEDLSWTGQAVIDDFADNLSIRDIAAVCGAVGFNTIPSWMKPFAILSNGEKFRVSLARLLIESKDLIVLDEFTSIVDRQVAKIGAHAVQKYIRRGKKKFVAVSCHSDILDWLQPDWVFEPSTCTFRWRSVQPRPKIAGRICRVSYSEWSRFAPYHYLTASLNKSARCFGFYVGEQVVSFSAILPRPISRGGDKGKVVYGISRVVTLPDWQGLGLGPRLNTTLAAMYASLGHRMRSYPSHPFLINTRVKDPDWRMIRRPGQFKSKSKTMTKQGGRTNAVFEYVGRAHANADESMSIINGESNQ